MSRILEFREQPILDARGHKIGTRGARNIDITNDAVLYHIHEVLRQVPPEFYFQAFKWYQWLKKRHQKQTAKAWQDARIELLVQQMRAASVWIIARGGSAAHDIIDTYVDEVVPS